MNSNELRKKFLDFFEKRGHKIVPSSSLVPADPTVLFTTAGMQQFSLYLSGEKDVLKEFGNRHLASIQKCVRTGDIEAIGDDTHNVFFEMLGNWSIGEDSQKGYFKEDSIKYAFEFLLDILGLDKEKLLITTFEGKGGIPKDEESVKICLALGFPKERMVTFGMDDNFWGPVGETGPCGPCLEIFYDRGREFGCGREDCGPNCSRCKRFVELWTLVFMKYFKDKRGDYKVLDQRNVDTGMGMERLTAILQNKPSGYETDLFWPIISEIEEMSGKKYEDEELALRIIADHIRAAVFVAAERIIPSNVEKGYVLRRLLRRTICNIKSLEMPENSLVTLARKTISLYKDAYPEVNSNQAEILTIFQNEEEKFGKTLEKGISETISAVSQEDITGRKAFKIYETYGCPLEYIERIAEEKGRKIVDKEGFYEAQKKHQEVSRAGAKKKFGGIGEGATYEATKLHTATHLLHQALREVLGEHVQQMGSDITPQRLRFDFSHPQRMTLEEVKEVEDLVNKKIEGDLKVDRREMSYEEAVRLGALAFFKEKYPDQVTVYSVGGFSKEICAGPHIKRTSELGHFRIIKEESSGAGVRRIRAVLE